MIFHFQATCFPACRSYSTHEAQVKISIKDGGSTALYAVCTVDIVDTVDTVDTVDMVYTVDMTHNEESFHTRLSCSNVSMGKTG